MLAFLLSKAGLTLIAVALVVAVIGVQTLRLDHAKADLTALRKADAAAEALAVERAKAGQAISAASQVQVASERAQIVTRTQTLVKQVKVYVPAAADAACVVPVGFVRLHDAAAQGLPAPSGGPDQTTSGVPLSAVAATVAANYGTAWDWRVEALGWRDWYLKQKAAWEAP